MKTNESNRKSIAVIGSGFGGLSTAIYLQARGINVTLFEARDLPGGRAYVYKQDGFTFDAGPTVITAPELIDELFELGGKKTSDYVTLLPVEPFYRLRWDDGYQFDYTNDSERLFRQIRDKCPEDEAGYKRFLEYSREVYNEGYSKLADVAFLDFKSMLKVAPQLIRLKAYQSVYTTISQYIKDPHLRQAFSFHSLLVGGNPFQASSIYTLIHYLERKGGVHFPKGGTGSLVQGLVRYFEDLGGKFRLNTPIQQIMTENGKACGVVTHQGRPERFDAVVSNADVMYTYRNLLAYEPKARIKEAKLAKMNFSNSLFVYYFGTKRKYENLAHHTILFGPRYKELLKDIYINKILPDDFSLYLHSPTRSDSSLAPEGCDTFYVLSPVAHLSGKNDVDWTKEGARYKNKILNYLENSVMPGVSSQLVTERIFTPLDFKTELNAHMGNAFSVAPTLLQSAYFRPHNEDSLIENLYFAGAGTHPGAGVPGVINSGKATARLILEKFSKAELNQSSPKASLYSQPLKAGRPRNDQPHA